MWLEQLGASPFLLVFLMGYCLAVIDGELRCYCNESGCVSTGYMCKSSMGRCFTSVDIKPENAKESSRPHTTHGCLDSLPPRHRIACTNVGPDDIALAAEGRALDVDGTNSETISDPGSQQYSNGVSEKHPLLLCCSEHMCNYVEGQSDQTGSLKKHTKELNGSLVHGQTFPHGDNAVSRNHGSNRDDDRDLWFKAAVIAVPIAGGFILVLLVLLAVRMLRTDSHNHRRLIQIRQERNLSKAHMYIADHFDNGNKEHHQCSLFDEKTGNVCSILYSSGTEVPATCVNLKTTTTTATSSVSSKPNISSKHKHTTHSPNYVSIFGSDCNNKTNIIRLKDRVGIIHSSTIIQSSNSCDKNKNKNKIVRPQCSRDKKDKLCRKEHCSSVSDSDRDSFRGESITSDSDTRPCSSCSEGDLSHGKKTKDENKGSVKNKVALDNSRQTLLERPIEHTDLSNIK